MFTSFCGHLLGEHRLELARLQAEVGPKSASRAPNLAGSGMFWSVLWSGSGQHWARWWPNMAGLRPTFGFDRSWPKLGLDSGKIQNCVISDKFGPEFWTSSGPIRLCPRAVLQLAISSEVGPVLVIFPRIRTKNRGLLVPSPIRAKVRHERRVEPPFRAGLKPPRWTCSGCPPPICSPEVRREGHSAKLESIPGDIALAFVPPALW